MKEFCDETSLHGLKYITEVHTHDDCFVKNEPFFFILNWKFRYLSWLRQYQTGEFVLLKQCYYYANMGTFFNINPNLSKKVKKKKTFRWFFSSFLRVVGVHFFRANPGLCRTTWTGHSACCGHSSSLSASSPSSISSLPSWTRSNPSPRGLTVCPTSSDPFYIVNHYMKWGTTSWTHSMYFANT